jgi:RNA polymerase sigma-70 factor (ECF subfamily)
MADPPSEQWTEQKGVSQKEVFERLFFRYYGPVVNFFVNRGFSSEESRDLAQETFLRIFKGLPTLRKDTATVFIFQVAHNLWKNRIREDTALKRQGHESSLEDLAIPAPESGPLETALADERASRVREALEILPPRSRRCLQLYVYHQLKVREIATLMNLSPETVKAHLYQARQSLRKHLEREFGNLSDPSL